ncbi:MAG: hypothetical protein JOS17DRAFT_796160 [Linnemannia elongata]|nr:MAG: hypothetical protein JOS17DRAFT_796160 [Linnemannia elongata]
MMLPQSYRSLGSLRTPSLSTGLLTEHKHTGSSCKDPGVSQVQVIDVLGESRQRPNVLQEGLDHRAVSGIGVILDARASAGLVLRQGSPALAFVLSGFPSIYLLPLGPRPSLRGFVRNCIDHLGFRIDTRTMTLSVPRSKVRDLRREAEKLLRSKATALRNLASFIGKAMAMTAAVFPARLMTRRLIQVQNQALANQ